MPKISVVCPTMRVGGIDILCHGLDQQTYRDFELVLVDCLYDYRKDVFNGVARATFPIKHVSPIENPFPVNSFCRCANTGLIYADCEIVLFITDYTWLPPYTLANHVAFHAFAPKPYRGLMSPHDYLGLPALAADFHPYGREDVDTYVQDLGSGKLTPFMYSIFAHEFDGINRLEHDPGAVHAGAKDLKIGYARGLVHQNWFHAKNESCLLEDALKINGWDEDLDGSHGWQDSDFSDRLVEKAGVTWFLDPSVIAYIVNPRFVLPHGKRTKDNQTSESHLMSAAQFVNEQTWFKKRAQGYPPVNTYSLREARQRVRTNAPTKGT
jgi:hypothetical protein